ncbi:hypothetical protein [Streptomyces sp. NPDC001816]|uniref:hypothetical protein n=1 Tax=Streptomyces sp. NPDC001816 TaxID=3364612 RepID=UPI003682EEC7
MALPVEGPGRGESRADGLTVAVTNYERATSRYIDFLAGLPEVDAERVERSLNGALQEPGRTSLDNKQTPGH